MSGASDFVRRSDCPVASCCLWRSGRPLTAAFEEAFVRSKPLRTVDTYGPRPREPLLPSPEDEEMLRSLRNLGYIQ